MNQLLTLFTKESNTLVVYAHNFSGFDGIFLLKHLLSYGKVEPLLHNGRILCIKVKLNIVGYTNKTIIFKDSYLLLPLGLRNLCKAFNVTNGKGYFPFNLTNIFYKGLLPELELWNNIPANDYTKLIAEFMGKVWSFKDEAIKYCYLDCVSLHEVLVQFNELIYSHFKININTPLTLPALAMRIFKSQFMPKDTIYQLLSTVESDIRESYTRGAVDVYIPHNRISDFFRSIKPLFRKLFWYDVNSLYPFIMAETPMPVGKPIAFEGDIRKVEPDAFGFFYCKITSPEYIKHPILQRRIKTSDGIRTVAGLGTWTGWIFSAEMDNAINNKFQFEILKGYQFKKGNIFKDYVNTMYALRMEFPKGTPMNLVAKFLMNSLYGKFGMKLESTQVEMFDTNDEVQKDLLNGMLEIYGESLHDYIKLDDTYVTVRKNLISLFYNEDLDMYHGIDVNIAIASAISAGARMWMSTLKNDPRFNLYYSDTDSAVTDKPLPSFMVGDNLGQLKLEYIVKKAVFLAPKVYAIITDTGEEIVKVKGFSNDTLSELNFKTLESLLYKDSSKEFSHNKYFKEVIKGDITISKVAYNLKVTSNKRLNVYVNDIFSSTEPYNYDEIINK